MVGGQCSVASLTSSEPNKLCRTASDALTGLPLSYLAVLCNGSSIRSFPHTHNELGACPLTLIVTLLFAITLYRTLALAHK